MEETPHQHGTGQKFHISIKTTVGTWTDNFESTLTVGQLIKLTLDHFAGKLTGDSYDLHKLGEEPALPVDQTLAQIGVVTGQVFQLSPSNPGGGR